MCYQEEDKQKLCTCLILNENNRKFKWKYARNSKKETRLHWSNPVGVKEYGKQATKSPKRNKETSRVIEGWIPRDKTSNDQALEKIRAHECEQGQVSKHKWGYSISEYIAKRAWHIDAKKKDRVISRILIFY